MPQAITTCAECRTQFGWNSDFQELPNCPNCGYNQKRNYKQADPATLVKWLYDKEHANNAAAELGRRRQFSAVKPLLASLGQGENLAAVFALGTIGDESAVEPLIALLHSKGPAASAAALSLAKIGTPDCVRAIVAEADRVYQGDTFIDVFRTLMNKDQSIGPIVAQLLEHHKTQVRDISIAVLREIGWEPDKLRDRVRFYVRIQRWEKLLEIREEAIRVLLEDQKGHCLLLTAEHIAEGLDQLNWVPEGDIVPYLLAKKHVQKIVELGAVAVPALISALRSENPAVRETAAKTLGKLRAEESAEELIAALEKSNGIERGAIIEALAALKDARAVPALIKVLRSSGYASITGDALVAIGEPAIAALIAEIEAKHPSGRHTAAKALGRLQARKAVPSLMRALDDDDKQFTWDVAEALGLIGCPSAVDVLISKLSSSDYGQRSSAAEALGRIGEKRAVPHLRARLRDSEEYVRKRAKTALEAMGEDATPLPWWQFW